MMINPTMLADCHWLLRVTAPANRAPTHSTIDHRNDIASTQEIQTTSKPCRNDVNAMKGAMAE